jgi:HlyD family secretion protein
MSKQQKIWIGVGVTVVVIIAAILVIASIRNQSGGSGSSATYQTTTVQVGTLTSTVEGAGTVASTQSVNLAWQTSGQVDQVLVQIGTQVKAGDVLGTLALDAKTLSALQTSLTTAQSNLAELTSPAAIATAQSTVAADEQALTNAQTGVANLTYHSQSAIDNAYASLILAENNWTQAKANYNKYLNVPDTDPAKANAYQVLYGAQLKYNSAVATYNAYKSNPSQSTIDSANAKLALATATLAQDKAYLAALTGGTVPADATGAALVKFEQAQLAVQTAQQNLAQNTITAPFDGTVTQESAVPGAVVSSGTPAFRIDNLTSLVVPVSVTEIDVNSVQVGQPATITFDAIPNKTYTGKVVKADMAGTVSANSTNFSVTVQITDADAKIKPGMAANVTITTNQVANALLIPTTSIFTDSAGQQYVYLVNSDGSTTTVTVTVGAVSDTTTQIMGNSLKQGDVIVLSFASTTTSGGGFGIGGMGGIGGGTRVESQPVPAP